LVEGAKIRSLHVLDLLLHERAEMALKTAVEKLIVESARLGRSIYIERNGEAVEVSGEELRELTARAEADGRTSSRIARRLR
jgi:hypothetical protein